MLPVGKLAISALPVLLKYPIVPPHPFLKNGCGATLGYFNNTGSADVANFPNGTNKPNSNGFIFQLEYLPWYNTKFAAQYVAYQKFDGSSTNYDGLGRDAHNNNTIYLLAWLSF